MATRAELKERAKACLKQYYWMALLVSVVASMLGAGQSGGVNFSFQTQSGSDTQYNGAGAVDHADYIAILILILSIFAVIFIIGLVVQAFLSNVVWVYVHILWKAVRQKQMPVLPDYFMDSIVVII